MKFIGFPFEVRYLPREQNAWVNLRFPDAKTPLSLRLLLDTGSAITILNRGLASVLNISEITETKEFIDLTLADLRTVRAYVHPVRVEFLGRQLTIDAAFVESHDTASVIGMRGFFDQMQIAFDHASRRVHVAFA